MAQALSALANGSGLLDLGEALLMVHQKAPGLGNVVMFPRPRPRKPRRISAPPLKRVHIGSELRRFLEQMAERGHP